MEKIRGRNLWSNSIFTGILTAAYKFYVRPTIEYETEIISTTIDLQWRWLEVQQNKAFRLILGAPRSPPITAMEIQADVEPLWLNVGSTNVTPRLVNSRWI